jgi:hypothetical protein
MFVKYCIWAPWFARINQLTNQRMPFRTTLYKIIINYMQYFYNSLNLFVVIYNYIQYIYLGQYIVCLHFIYIYTYSIFLLWSSSAVSIRCKIDHVTRRHMNKTKSAYRMSVIFTRQVTTLNAAQISHHSFSQKIHHTEGQYTAWIRDLRQNILSDEIIPSSMTGLLRLC